MSSSDTFRCMFQGCPLEVEDLFLLESFQISYLPGWVPEREFAAVLWSLPTLERFLLKKYPPIADLVERSMAKFGPAASEKQLIAFGDELVWTIADLLIYNKCPEVYDSLEFHNWDFGEVKTITSLDKKRVIDGGAGTGRVALQAALSAVEVYAVEPVGRLRKFIQQKAIESGLNNVFVLDGFLHTIPLPDDFADVLITSHALGWQIEDELREFERIVRPGGHIIHCPGTAEIPSEEKQHRRLISAEWGYQFTRYREADGWKRKYWKQMPPTRHAKDRPRELGYTVKQGQYLAFIYHYTKLHGQPPAEADMQYYFHTSPPSVHQMVLRLEAKGFISREPGKPRTIEVLVPPNQIPELD